MVGTVTSKSDRGCKGHKFFNHLVFVFTKKTLESLERVKPIEITKQVDKVKII